MKRGYHALVVADANTRMRRLIRSIIEPLIDRIDECACFEDAALQYSRFQPDFVIADVDLRTAAGIAVLLQIRRMDPEAQLLIVTDDDSSEFRHATQRLQVWRYVEKQDLTKLAQAIADLTLLSKPEGG